MKSIIIITFITLITIIKIIPALAFEDIGYSRIHPASPLYFLKSVKEILELKLALTPRVKQLRELEFAFRRLREAKTLLTINQDLIPPTLERYIAQIDDLTSSHQNDEAGIKVQEGVNLHLKVLQQMYSESSNLRAKSSIRRTMNKLIKRADILNSVKATVCDFFSKEASSSSLNKIEQVVLKVRAQSCFEGVKS